MKNSNDRYFYLFNKNNHIKSNAILLQITKLKIAIFIIIMFIKTFKSIYFLIYYET